jgi:spore germination protein GerM
MVGSGCAATSEERGGPGADGTPVVVVGQCAEDAPDCADTAVDNGSATAAGGDTPTTVVTSTTEASTTTQSTELQTVEVAFTALGGECDDVIAFERQIDSSQESIVAAFESLVAGPTAEEKASGADSFFSADTSGMVVSAAIDQELLVVDFEDLRSVIPNASTSCGSMALLAQLNTTAFRFDRIERVRYQIEGSCDTFANWLQRECMEYTRNGAQPAQP